MATLQEIRAKLDELDAATADREAKRTQYELDTSAEAEAITTNEQSRQAWRTALENEHEIEDAFETLVADYEPPSVPT